MTLRRSEFESELDRILHIASSRLTDILLSDAMKAGDVAGLISECNYYLGELRSFESYLDKYDRFFDILEDRHGVQTKDLLRGMRKTVSLIKTEVSRLKDLVAERKFEIAKAEYQELLKNTKELRSDIDTLAALPSKIDYSRLDNDAWKMIGIPGIHYKSRVFLSYPWRDKNPMKDENEKMLKDYVKPVLELLGIVPVTLRDRTLPQEPIDDRAVQLIRDCDGIIGFYTKGDKVINVEREISQNPNLVALCNENGSSGPAMRRDKWQIDFSRNEMAGFLMQLTKALKEKRVFRIVAEEPPLSR